jgi:cytochrome c peroxidase
MALSSKSAALALIRKDESYRPAFKEAFGKELETIAESDLGQAIASYERSLIFGDSPFDRFQYKGERDAMSPAAVRGLAVFMAWGRCVVCHPIEPSSAIFTDNRFHNIGVGINRFPRQLEALATGADGGSRKDGHSNKKSKHDTPASLTSELGRFAVTRNMDDLGAFKTPGLRNVAMTAPYMHDGSLKTLRDVVLHYVNGGFSPGDVERNEHMDPAIQYLEVSGQQIDDLVAFLEALTSPRFSSSQPPAKDLH